MSKQATCGVCGGTEEIKRLKDTGMLPDLPLGWAAVSVYVQSVVNRVVCAGCLVKVQRVLGA